MHPGFIWEAVGKGVIVVNDYGHEYGFMFTVRCGAAINQILFAGPGVFPLAIQPDFFIGKNALNGLITPHILQPYFHIAGLFAFAFVAYVEDEGLQEVVLAASLSRDLIPQKKNT